MAKGLLLKVMLVLATCLGTLTIPSAKSSDRPKLMDLTPPGWERDVGLAKIMFDRYKSPTGSLTVDLLALPAVGKTAVGLIDEISEGIIESREGLGYVASMLNDDELGTDNATGAMNEFDDGVDVATRTIVLRRPQSDRRPSFILARAIVRTDEVAQISVVTMPDSEVTDQERKQTTELQFNARMPVYESAMLLGPKVGRSLIISRLILQLFGTDEKMNLARPFTSLPGPQVALTGEWLGPLPAGYRMDVRTTNYWTNLDMTATRKLFLTLTHDGQFDKGHWAIHGGGPGSVGGLPAIASAGNREGSVSSVLGDTNPGGPGARSVTMNKREGLDPEKYGTYYISGNQIELVYASDKVEKLSFKTNGYNELVIDEKRYFVDTPNGWERRNLKDKTMYRSLDGAYLASVVTIKRKVMDGVEWMEDYRARLNRKSLLQSSGALKRFKGRLSHYSVVKMPVVFAGNAVRSNKEFYLRFGRGGRTRLVTVDRFAGASGEKVMLDFMYHVD